MWPSLGPLQVMVLGSDQAVDSGMVKRVWENEGYGTSTIFEATVGGATKKFSVSAPYLFTLIRPWPCLYVC
jgi:hypothetical protein